MQTLNNRNNHFSPLLGVRVRLIEVSVTWQQKLGSLATSCFKATEHRSIDIYVLRHYRIPSIDPGSYSKFILEKHGKSFVQPQVVPPSHGYQVTKPLKQTIIER